MEKFKDNLNKAASDIKFTQHERTELRERLLSYMEYYPLPEKVGATKARAYVEARTFRALGFGLGAFRARLAASAFMILLLVGVPFVAERSVPGDKLYPVKVRFNEEIRSGLTLSSYEKVAWETERLERRIAEARLLASEGKLTEKVEAEVAAAVREHTDAAQAEIDEIRIDNEEDAAFAEITFASALGVQAAVLAADEEASGAEVGESAVSDIVTAVVEAEETAVQKGASTTLPFKRLLGQFEIETTRAEELLKSVRTIASESEVADIETGLLEVGEKVEKAKDIRPDKPKRARTLLKEAFSETHKLIVFMTDIDVRNVIGVDALVESTEVSSTTIALVQASHADVAAAIQRYEGALGEAATGTRGILEAGLSTLNHYKSQFEVMIEEGSYTRSSVLISDATELMTSLEAVLAEDEERRVLDALLQQIDTTSTSTGTTTPDSSVLGASTTSRINPEVRIATTSSSTTATSTTSEVSADSAEETGV